MYYRPWVKVLIRDPFNEGLYYYGQTVLIPPMETTQHPNRQLLQSRHKNLNSHLFLGGSIYGTLFQSDRIFCIVLQIGQAVWRSFPASYPRTNVWTGSGGDSSFSQ